MDRIKHVAIVASLLLAGCNPVEDGTPAGNRLESILQGLRSDDLKTRMAAAEELHKLADQGLSEDEGVYALRAASERFPALEYEWQDAGGELVFAAFQNIRPPYAREVEANFASYSPVAQAHALRLLSTLEDRQAAEILLKVLDDVSDDTRLVSLGTLEETPRHSDVLFPAIVPYVHRPGLQWAISEVFLAYVSSGAIRDVESKSQISSAMITIHDELQNALVPLQQEQGEAWIWEDSYQDARSLAALVLDVLGHVETEEAERELSECVAYKDPRLKMFAILGLVRLGKDPELVEFERVAASAESRIWLHRRLAELKRLDLYPPQYATQEAFAEGVMVNWLVYPTELARVPDAIELMAVVPRMYGDGEAEFYVFRFRTFEPHWAAEDGWTAGVAGPFMKSESPSPESYGGTFSTFSAWDECSPEEHVERIEALLEESRQQASN